MALILAVALKWMDGEGQKNYLPKKKKFKNTEIDWSYSVLESQIS